MSPGRSSPGVSGVDDLVADLPLVERSRHGWVALHPLWSPSLRRLLTDADADDARRRAAAVHRGAGRFSLAVDLLSEIGGLGGRARGDP